MGVRRRKEKNPPRTEMISVGQRAWPVRVPSSVTQPHGGWHDGWSGARGPGQDTVADLGSVGGSRRVGAATVPPVAPAWLGRALGRLLAPGPQAAQPGWGVGAVASVCSSVQWVICHQRTVVHVPSGCLQSAANTSPSPALALPPRSALGIRNVWGEGAFSLKFTPH